MSDPRQSPAVDVILPTHARPHTIGLAIKSVLRQTYPHLTLHVVGDGCDEATASLVRLSGDARVTFHRFPKAAGYGYANRNIVLRSLTGDLVAYATDDDLWFPDHLEHGVEAILDDGLDYLVTRSVHVASNGRLDPHFFAFDWHTPVLSAFLRNWFLGAGNIVHRRSVFDTIGYLNEDLVRFGDRELYSRCRRSPLAGQYRAHPTIVRFYAQDWDPLYPSLDEPPQARFLESLSDPAWCDAIRGDALRGRRSLAVRSRQWRDMTRFARRSGPKFVKFLLGRRRIDANQIYAHRPT